ncbi:MAG: phytanoyl-CoA dioxygenase family protein [Burkholderiales bacterium]|nr:phytanoyl-CoA dioxygenase family protein [Burkholderiales bacterium]
MASIFTDRHRAEYARDGFTFVRGLFDPEETRILVSAMEQDPSLKAALYDRRDAQGKATRMATWNHPGDSVYGLAARSRRVVDTMEEMLGGEVYHYHSKLTAKEPFDGGAWEWHQDYGYWYHNGCVRPDMASVMVALDRATRENGCLQVVPGTHRVGRIEHGVLPGEQVGADPVRVEQILKRYPVVHAEMAPGDALFFHANVLHRSDQNRSPNRRWTVLFCFNAASNDPYLEHHHPGYTPLVKVDDDAIKAAGVRFAGSQAEFRERSANPPELTRRIA